MGTAARMALILTASVATVLCQACTTHSSVANSADYLSEPAVTELSDGQRLATDASFGVATVPPVETYTFHASTTSILNRQAPVRAPVIPLVDSENDILEAFAINAPRSQAEVGLTNLSWSSSDAVRAFEGNRNIQSLMQPVQPDQNFSAEFAFAAPAESTGLGFDLTVSPRVAYNTEGNLQSRRVGAEVRVGQTLNFDQRGERVDVDSWYVFAGQDGEALVWEAGEHGFSNITGAMALRDQVTVGDLQAGISVQRGAGELSLSYIHREVEWQDRNGSFRTFEDFAGVSFTMRR